MGPVFMIKWSSFVSDAMILALASQYSSESVIPCFSASLLRDTQGLSGSTSKMFPKKGIDGGWAIGLGVVIVYSVASHSRNGLSRCHKSKRRLCTQLIAKNGEEREEIPEGDKRILIISDRSYYGSQLLSRLPNHRGAPIARSILRSSAKTRAAAYQGTRHAVLCSVLPNIYFQLSQKNKGNSHGSNYIRAMWILLTECKRNHTRQ